MRILNGDNPYSSNRVSDEYISVNSCGFHDLSDADMTTLRPDGRLDYQFIYLARGRATFFVGGEAETAVAGDVIVYKPGEEQRYTYYAGEKTQAYWLHFSGQGAQQLLQKARLWEKTIWHAGVTQEIPDLILQMIHELQLKRYQYELFVNACFLSLLARVARRITTRENAAIAARAEPLENVLSRIHDDCRENASVAEYARMCNQSESQFLRAFKAFTGVSPVCYRTRVRMDKAKDLMAYTTLNISEIALAVGYENPLYFSRLFHRHTGLTPTGYRSAFRRRV